jgi:cell wall-associated NlpC family hydrolase
MALTNQQWATIERRTGVPRHVMQVLLGRGERSSQSSVSPKGAYGRAQLMPDTARALERQYKISTKGEFGNVLGGAYYLAQQKRAFGNWKLAFAAYNAGGGAVRRYGGVPPYKETQDYVRRTMAALQGGGASPGGSVPGRMHAQPPGIARLPGQPDFSQANRNALMDMVEGDYDPLKQLQQMQAAIRQQGQRVISLGKNPQGQPIPITKSGGKITPLDQKALHLVQSAMGTPYVWGGAKPGGFDCSGLLQWAWGKLGIQIPRTTYDQWSAGKAVPRGRLRVGDAVFFRGSDARGNLPGHVGFYIGNGKFIEAPHTGANVRISKLAGRRDYQGARRFG